MATPPSFGATLTLHSGQSIQAAIDSATDGDEIVLERGVYNGGISFRGKGVTLRSIDPDDSSVVAQTVINETGFNETGFNSIVTFYSGETPESILAGLTIRGAVKGEGGISIHNSSPSIQSCVISYNVSPTGAGGVTCLNASPVIQKSIFKYNQGNLAGGILLIGSSHLTIDNCAFHDNQSSNDGGGINIGATSSTSLLRCTFEDNSAHHGGGVLSTGNGTGFRNCIFYDNKADFGTSVHCWGDRNTELRNCIFTSKPGVILNFPPIFCEESYTIHSVLNDCA